MSDALKHESDVRAYIATLQTDAPASKDDVRRVLLARKLETLVANRVALKQQEKRALNLMRKVDYDNIRPVLVHVSGNDLKLWKYVRMLVSSAPFLGRPGRSNFCFCIDWQTNGLLGVLEIGSDVQALSPRDKHIGWDKERKYDGGLNLLGNVGTCVSVQPFGALCGGKFMIEATNTSTFTELWQHRYGHPLAGVVVTSLFGKSSIYNRCPSFTYLGDTKGQGTAHVDAAGAKLLKQFLRDNNILSRTGGVGIRMDNKSDLLERACAVLKIPRESIASHQPRGVYFAPTGERSLPFLRGETDDFVPFNRSQVELWDWWRDRWYAMRKPKVDLSFDFDAYRVDNQIDLCLAEMTRGSDSGDL